MEVPLDETRESTGPLLAGCVVMEDRPRRLPLMPPSLHEPSDAISPNVTSRSPLLHCVLHLTEPVDVVFFGVNATERLAEDLIAARLGRLEVVSGRPVASAGEEPWNVPPSSGISARSRNDPRIR